MNKKNLEKIRSIHKDIETFYFIKVLPKIYKRSLRKTYHFKEWYGVPMDYVRLIELPTAIFLMGKSKRESQFLDISSPKLMSLFLALNKFPNMVISDIDSYFVKDFKLYSKEFGFRTTIKTFDAKKIPYQDNSFDCVFSVSVLEHIPNGGDIRVAKEIRRILKKDGTFVMTCPASNQYKEEWLVKKHFYWPSKRRQDGRFFFQRIYNEEKIINLSKKAGFEIDEILYVAEKPIKKMRLDENGVYLNNYNYLEEFRLVKILNFLKSRLKFPLFPYFIYRYFSNKCHYLTKNPSDQNIRLAAIRFRKK